MILGVGVDIIQVSRIQKAMERKNFLKDTFTEKELSCYHKAGCPPEGIASRFAVKEAVFKALGTGWVKGTDIEVLIETSGKPYVILHGQTEQTATKLRVKRVEVSLSYYEDTAIGFAVAEK